VNIGQLKTKITAWLDRSDLDDYVGDFVQLAADRIYRLARTPANETIISGTTTNGRIEIPGDFVQVKWIRINNTTFLSPTTQVYESFDGNPVNYGRLGDYIYLVPQSTAEFKMSYYNTESVSSDTDEPELLQAGLDLFLYGSLAEAAPFLQDDARIAVWEAKFNTALLSLKGLGDDADLNNVLQIGSTQ